MTLTLNEIYDLAFLAGLKIEDRPEDGDMTITVGNCPETGIHLEPSGYKHYRMIAWFEEYPEEGSLGLGPELNSVYSYALPK